MKHKQADINFIIGDATNPHCKRTIITHCCNNIGGWGSGFVVALSKKWEKPERKYRKWFAERNNPDSFDPYFKLGAVQIVDLPRGISVANIIGQNGVRSADNLKPVVYEALAQGLESVNDVARKTGATLTMPRIGCGLAGGDWEEVEKLIHEHVTVPVWVYDLPGQEYKDCLYSEIFEEEDYDL